MKIVLPKDIYNVMEEPLFFIGGPIKGGGDWQSACCVEISRNIADFCAAVPCRYSLNHRLYPYKVGERFFDRQLPWERYYLNQAAHKGCVIFWLPTESVEYPRNDGFPYAMDTRGELGEWRGRLMYDKELKVVIGAEKDFPGRDVMSRNFSEALGAPFPVYDTLEETVAEAVTLSRRPTI
ncbi:MAG: hypothetical protein PHG66_03950 [Candidatus Colwellbacteria bacterium]|nr:hypothetical protein [Candidatus Colwellbacteria bacterium]